nr:outer membrane beta-barrel protein [Luteibacter yeojuensis]
MRLGWDPSPRNAFVVTGAYQYADAAQDIITAPGAFGIGTVADRVEPIDPFANTGGLGNGTGTSIGTGSAVIGSDVYKERRFDASWNWRGDRLNVTVSPSFSKLRYLNDRTFDQNDRAISIGIGYRLRPTVTLNGFLMGDKLDYQAIDRRDTTVRMGLNLTKQWNQHWSGQVSVARERRSSTAAGQDYRANAIYVGVVYRR